MYGSIASVRSEHSDNAMFMASFWRSVIPLRILAGLKRTMAVANSINEYRDARKLYLKIHGWGDRRPEGLDELRWGGTPQAFKGTLSLSSVNSCIKDFGP